MREQTDSLEFYLLILVILGIINLVVSCENQEAMALKETNCQESLYWSSLDTPDLSRDCLYNLSGWRVLQKSSEGFLIEFNPYLDQEIRKNLSNHKLALLYVESTSEDLNDLISFRENLKNFYAKYIELHVYIDQEGRKKMIPKLLFYSEIIP